MHDRGAVTDRRAVGAHAHVLAAQYEGGGAVVLDRGAIGKVRFENIWGVSDEDLFDLSLRHFDELHAKGRPFFSIVMTTSNHKPFTFRKGLEQLGIPEKGGGRPAGASASVTSLANFAIMPPAS